MVVDVLAMVADVMITKLQMMLADVDAMVVDVMTNHIVCAIWQMLESIVVDAITTGQHVF